MAKKEFRAFSQKQPCYPKASELTSSSLRKLGLAALGGILLGGTPGVSRTEAEEAKPARTKPAQGGAKKAKPAKDATGTSAPNREPRFMPNGGKPAPRIVEVDVSPAETDGRKPSQQKDGGKAGTTTGTTTAPTAPLPPPGEPPAARMPKDEKSPPASKREGTAAKTDSKKQPEVLPTAGVPPLPRNPEPVPAPKKSK